MTFAQPGGTPCGGGRRDWRAGAALRVCLLLTLVVTPVAYSLLDDSRSKVALALISASSLKNLLK